MKRRDVVFAPSADDDLMAIYNWIADQTDEVVALGYIQKVERYCAGFDLAAERGQSLDDVYSGLRFVGFKKSATIVCQVTIDTVRIIGVYRAGLDWRPHLLREFRTDG